MGQILAGILIAIVAYLFGYKRGRWIQEIEDKDDEEFETITKC